MLDFIISVLEITLGVVFAVIVLFFMLMVTVRISNLNKLKADKVDLTEEEEIALAKARDVIRDIKRAEAREATKEEVEKLEDMEKDIESIKEM